MNTIQRELVYILSRFTNADLERLQRHELQWLNDRLYRLQTQTRERLHGKPRQTAALFSVHARAHREESV